MAYKLTDIATPEKLLTTTNELFASVPTKETFTLATTDWTPLLGYAPFAYQANIIVDGIGADTIVSLAMDVVEQATFGIVVGDVIETTVWFYALTQPTASVSGNLIMEG